MERPDATARRSVTGPLITLGCCAVGLVAFGAALEIVVNRSQTAVGPVSDVYLTLVVGALLVLLGTLVWLQHDARSRHGAGTDAETGPETDAGTDAETDAGTDAGTGLAAVGGATAPLSPPVFQSLSLAATDPTERRGPQPAGPVAAETPEVRAVGQERPTAQMLEAYKRAAERHSTDAAHQRARAEAAEAALRELHAWIAADGAGEQAVAPRSPRPPGSSHLARSAHARDPVRGSRHEGASDGRTVVSDGSPTGRVAAVRRLLALAASCERQRIQDLLQRLSVENDDMLPPDHAQLAREQADHFRHAIENLSIAETVRMAEERTDTLDRKDAATLPSPS